LFGDIILTKPADKKKTNDKKSEMKDDEPQAPVLPDSIKHFNGKERNPREGRKALEKYELSYSSVYTVGTSFVTVNTIQSLHDNDFNTGLAVATASPAWIQAKFKKICLLLVLLSLLFIKIHHTGVQQMGMVVKSNTL